MDSDHLILDTDGVLLDFIGGFTAFMTKKGHRAAIAQHQTRDYDMRDLWPQLPDPERFALMHQYLADESFAAIPHIDGAYEAIRLIRREHPGVKISAVTAIGSNPRARAARIENLKEFGISDVSFVPIAGSKADELFRFPVGSVFVDDLPKHIDDGIVAGHRSYLFRQPHNTAVTRLPTLRNWDDAVAVIVADLAEPKLEPAL